MKAVSAPVTPVLLNAFMAVQGKPTPLQWRAWECLAENPHALISSPTGSGKTWAALLPIFSDINPNPTDSTLALWISPLKALVSDTATRISQFAELLRCQNSSLARIRVSARTGDIPASQRSRDRAHPPHIWCVTPESLAIWLTIPAMVNRLKNVRWLVVDEIHSVAASRRGADLALSLERLEERLENPPRRIGISATCHPLAAAGRFLFGPGRPFATVECADDSPLELKVEHLPHEFDTTKTILERIFKELDHHQTTIVFTRTRASAERLAWTCRKERPALPVGIHHGSLAPEIRRETETRLRAGHLRLVFSSTSLELGMDIGAIGLVVLVHPSGEVVRLLQRIGRSGRGPGKTRQGLVLAANPSELLEAVVTATAGREGATEALMPIGVCEDVLCQHLMAEAMLGSCRLESFLEVARRTGPYQELEASVFLECLAYLRGELGNQQSLVPRLRLLPDGRHVIARPRMKYQLRQSLGAISATASRKVMLRDSTSDRVMGEVEPAYADALRAGDRFLLEGKCVQVARLSGPDVEVVEASRMASPPRWTGEPLPLSPLLASHLQALRDEAARIIAENPSLLASWLEKRHQLPPKESSFLAEYFISQECHGEIPHANCLIAEISPCGDEWLLAMHTPLNRAGNEAIARLVARRLSRNRRAAGQSMVADLGLAFRLEHPPGQPAEWLRIILKPENALADLEEAVAPSDLVRRRFQEIAVTALMTPRLPPKNKGSRSPKVGGGGWVARRLYDQCLRRAPGFILARQALREILTTWIDAAAALAWLERVACLPAKVRWLPCPSPFIRHWTQLGQGPELAPESPEDALKNLRNKIMGVSA